MRLDDLGSEAVAKRYMRFGRRSANGDESEEAIGSSIDDEEDQPIDAAAADHAIRDDKRYMRFGKRYMRFGKRYMRFGRSV